jgi:hypothetical protein
VPSPAAAAPAPAPPAMLPPVVTPATSPVAHAGAAVRPVVTPVAVATTPAPASDGTFDAELGGRRGLDNARACFTKARVGGGVVFGAGLLYGRDGVSRKVYFGTQERLSPEERRCVARSLVGVSAGGATGKNVIVEYVMHYRSTGADVKVRR